MVFSSLEFIFIFLPLFLAAYYLVSPKIKISAVFCFQSCFLCLWYDRKFFVRGFDSVFYSYKLLGGAGD